MLLCKKGTLFALYDMTCLEEAEALRIREAAEDVGVGLRQAGSIIADEAVGRLLFRGTCRDIFWTECFNKRKEQKI